MNAATILESSLYVSLPNIVKIRWRDGRGEVSVIMPKKKTVSVDAPPRPRKRVVGNMRTCYPQVKMMLLELTYKDGHSSRISRTEIAVREPDDSAAFFMPCGSSECLDGGYDLTEAIDLLVSERQRSRSGLIACEGWYVEGKDAVCPCKSGLQYKIAVLYHDDM